MCDNLYYEFPVIVDDNAATEDLSRVHGGQRRSYTSCPGFIYNGNLVQSRLGPGSEHHDQRHAAHRVARILYGYNSFN